MLKDTKPSGKSLKFITDPPSAVNMFTKLPSTLKEDTNFTWDKVLFKACSSLLLSVATTPSFSDVVLSKLKFKTRTAILPKPRIGRILQKN